MSMKLFLILLSNLCFLLYLILLCSKKEICFYYKILSSLKTVSHNRKNFSISSIPILLSIPKTTRAPFFPSCIPKYSRTLPDSYKNLVESLILSSKSINYLKMSLTKLNLPFNHQQIERIVNEVAEDFKAINSQAP